VKKGDEKCSGARVVLRIWVEGGRVKDPVFVTGSDERFLLSFLFSFVLLLPPPHLFPV
jgi:hypothetical protein